jgi:hypothetical protein
MNIAQYALPMVFVAAFAVTPTHADVIVPTDLRDVEGSANNCIPFTCAPHLFGADRSYQQLYAATLFPDDVVIRSIAFRPDGEHGAPFTFVYSDVRVRLGTTSVTPDSFGESGFVSGVGMKTVYTGALTLTSGDIGPSSGPKVFDIVINFTDPFHYSPAAGTLLFEFQDLGSDSVPDDEVLNALLDSDNSLVDGTSRRYVNNSGFGADEAALVTKFETAAPIPEPGSLVLCGLALTGIAARVRRRNTRDVLSGLSPDRNAGRS